MYAPNSISPEFICILASIFLCGPSNRTEKRYEGGWAKKRFVNGIQNTMGNGRIVVEMACQEASVVVVAALLNKLEFRLNFAADHSNRKGISLWTLKGTRGALKPAEFHELDNEVNLGMPKASLLCRYFIGLSALECVIRFEKQCRNVPHTWSDLFSTWYSTCSN